RDSDRAACALIRVSCRALASTSRGEGATVQPSMSLAILPLREVASLRYARAVAAAVFFGVPADFPVPAPPPARSRTYFVPDARSTTGRARRATPWTTGLISSLPLLMYRSAVFRLSVTRLVLCRGLDERAGVGIDRGHSSRLDCQFDELTLPVGSVESAQSGSTEAGIELRRQCLRVGGGDVGGVEIRDDSADDRFTASVRAEPVLRVHDGHPLRRSEERRVGK